MAAARITGLVLGTDRRQGTSEKSGKAYDFTEVRVLVANSDIATFTVRGNDAAQLQQGDHVDVLVEQDVYGGRLSSSYRSPWPASVTDAA